MTALDAVLTAASGAVVGTMGTDLYHYTRERLASLIRKDDNTPEMPEPAVAQLDALNEAITVTPELERRSLSEGMTPIVKQILTHHATAKDIEWLEDFVSDITKRIESPTVNTVFNNQTVTDNLVIGGSINTAGRDNNIGGGSR